MDVIISFVTIGAILLAIVSRVIEEDRKQKKIARMMQRTNTKPWSRSKR